MSNPKRILFIDDDPDIHSAVRMIFESRGDTVQCCTTAAAGLAAARAQRPDVILLDIMLSEPTEGFHVAYELKKDEDLCDVPIIMISAIGRSVSMDFAREVGTNYLPAVAFIEKPFEAGTLIDAVDTALHGGAAHVCNHSGAGDVPE